MIAPLTSKPRLVLLLGDEGARLAIHDPANAANAQTLFAAARDEAAEKKILDLVAQHGKTSRLTLLLDTLAQDYRVESLPRVNLFDRARLIRNRLRQSYPQAAATAALKIDSSRIGLASWRADNALQLWLDKLNPLAPRIALLPVEGASLAPRDEWAIIMSLQRTGGLRQIVTSKGQTIFTRQTPAPEKMTTESIAAAAVQDLKTTLGYLNRLGLDDSRKLHVIALLPESARPAFEQAGPALRKLTLLAQDELYGDAFFANDLAKRQSLRLDVTPQRWKETRRDNALKKTGMRIGIAAMALSILSLGWQAATLAQTLKTARQEIAQRDEAQAALNKEREESSSVEEPLIRLRAAAERERVFTDPSPAPWPALDSLLQSLPLDMRLDAMDWQSPQTSPPRREETLRLTLRLPATENREQWRMRLQETSQIIAQALPGYSLILARSPYPATPQEPLTGSDNASPSQIPAAEILLTRKTESMP